ncbi:MAG: hypothetical protein NVSMB9_24160 [Isosphaeraceae bacterium]
MAWLRVLGNSAGSIVRVVVLAPLLALLLASVLDRGPNGSTRLSLFPAAIALLDPFVWECARNSLALAAAVTFFAGILGVGLARLAVRWRFWGRAPLVALAAAGLAVPPAFAALGLRAIFGSPTGPWTVWAFWFWASLLTAAPIVGLAAASSLTGGAPIREDAARLAGAGRSRIWRQLVWPSVRPDVASALAFVFALTLLEPGAPLVLGLRRTLAFQVVASSLDPGPGHLSRASVLALAAIGLSLAARVLLGWWGGSRTPLAPRNADTPPIAPTASSPRGFVFVCLLTACAVATWLPVLGLLTAALAHPTGDSSRFPLTFAPYTAILGDPLARDSLIHSAILGLAVVALDLPLARLLALRSAPGNDRTRASVWPWALPPLAIGVGLLGLSLILQMIFMALPFPDGPRPLPDALATVIETLDPDRTPWAVLVLGVGLLHLPLLTRSAIEQRRAVRPVLLDAALTLGSSPRRARRALHGQRLGVPLAALVLTFALAATSLTPALILSPTAETRPVSPAAILLLDDPDGGFPRASALASLAVAVNLAALAFAARQRASSR